MVLCGVDLGRPIHKQGVSDESKECQMEIVEYFSSSYLLTGLWIAIKITAVAMVAGLALGLVLAMMRLSSIRAISGIAWVYI